MPDIICSRVYPADTIAPEMQLSINTSASVKHIVQESTINKDPECEDKGVGDPKETEVCDNNFHSL